MLAADHHFRARLPAPVYDLALRLGVKPGDNRSTVRLTQVGRMKRSVDVDAWMDFTATQTISTRDCEFDWRARVGFLGIVSARDTLLDGAGRFDITALGFIPVARAKHTPALVRGELMRYLAELPWSPDAILLNASLRWRADGPDTLAVSAGAEDTASEVVLSLDSAGRIAGAFAPDRPRSASAPTLPTPWHGRFSDYRSHGDKLIPFSGEVAWEIGGIKNTYWQGRIKTWHSD
ncbi:MAG: DUF6920 family protein [Hyphomicrobium sp.]